MPHDDPRRLVDVMLETGYNEEFCIAANFDPAFIARLMEAGFLVMSAGGWGQENQRLFVLLPKLHLTRSALFFDNLRIKKSIRRYLENYRLEIDADFDFILDRCVQIHGDEWLTPPLIDAIRQIRRLSGNASQTTAAGAAFRVQPVSFALYRDDALVAGEFGIMSGRVYTSYSGYHDESNAGTVQLIKTTQYLRDNGFAFFDLGMPLDYKTSLGAVNISPEEFVRHFRDAQYPRQMNLN